MIKAALYLRVSTDDKGQDPILQRKDLTELCQQRGYDVVAEYVTHESAFGKKKREQFAGMIEDARRAKFQVLCVWSMDRFSRESPWTVAEYMNLLRSYGVKLVSYSQSWLDFTSPLGEMLGTIFAWIAHEDSLRKGNATRLGMEKAKAQGKAIGRPKVAINVELVLDLRAQGMSWRKIADRHPEVKVNGKAVKPSVPSLIRAINNRSKGKLI